MMGLEEKIDVRYSVHPIPSVTESHSLHSQNSEKRKSLNHQKKVRTHEKDIGGTESIACFGYLKKRF